MVLDKERIKELESENKTLHKCLEFQHKRHCDELELLYKIIDDLECKVDLDQNGNS